MRRGIVVVCCAVAMAMVHGSALARSVSLTDPQDIAYPDADLSESGYVTHLRDDGEVRSRFWLETYGGRIGFSDITLQIDTDADGQTNVTVFCEAGCTLHSAAGTFAVHDTVRTVGGVQRYFIYFPKHLLHATARIAWRFQTHDGTEEGYDVAPNAGWYQS